jgi:hypothetical protein
MKMTSTSRRMAAWFACFAILLGVLAPSISHALAEARGQSLVWEICRSDSRVGQPTVKPVDGQLPVSGDPMAHCAYCLPHGGSDGLLPPLYALPVFAIAGVMRPDSFHLAELPQPARAVPPARGPPVLA